MSWLKKYKQLSQEEFDQIKGLFAMKFSLSKVCEITGRSFDTVMRVRKSDTLEAAKAIAIERLKKYREASGTPLNGEFTEALKQVAEKADELNKAIYGLQVEAGKSQRATDTAKQVKVLT